MAKQRIRSGDWESIRERSPRAPAWFCRHFLGVDLWPKQIEIIESVRDNPRTAVVACHSIGKSFLTACAVIWFLLCHPESYVVLSAPTWRQVSEVLWAEVRRLFFDAPFELGNDPLVTPKWELGPKWKCLGFSAKEPERVQGFHAKYILIVIDEASGVPDRLFEGLKSLMASGAIVRLLLLSNATRPEGELHAAFYHKRHMYKTFQISAWDTPNLAGIKDECMASPTPEARWKIMRAAPVPRPYLINASFVADAEEECGWDSDYYRVRCLGQFPKGGDGQLIPLEHVEAAIHRWEKLLYPTDGCQRVTPWWERLHEIPHTQMIRAALDVARFGSNESVWGARLEDVCGPIHHWQGLDTVQLTGNVQELIPLYNVRHQAVDENGLGGGPLDNLVHWGHPGLTVLGFKGGAAATNVDRYGNLRCEAYHDLAARLSQKRLAFERNENLIRDLCSIRYKYRPGGQRMMESKDEIVKSGRKSPDYGDYLMMLCSKIAEGAGVQAWTGEEATNWDGMFG